MKIFTTNENDIGMFADFFRGHSVELVPEKYRDLEADLIVFPGGIDVHPQFYGSTIPGSYNEKRDMRELDILRSIRAGRVKTKKTLGICRGIQLLNVGLGGNLVYDIASRYGRPHQRVHPLVWEHTSPLSELLPETNSLHHQGIDYVGDNMTVRVLAREPITAMPEVVVWNNSILGIQSHPEYFRDRTLKDKIVAVLEKWVNDEFSFMASKVPLKKKVEFNWAPPDLHIAGEEEE